MAAKGLLETLGGKEEEAGFWEATSEPLRLVPGFMDLPGLLA